MISTKKLFANVLRNRICLQSQCKLPLTAFSSMSGNSEISSLTAMLRSHAPSPDITHPPVRETNAFKPDHLKAPAEVARHRKEIKGKIQDEIFRGWRSGSFSDVLSAYSRSRSLLLYLIFTDYISSFVLLCIIAIVGSNWICSMALLVFTSVVLI